MLFALGENSPRILRAAQGRLSGLIYDPKKEGEAGPTREEADELPFHHPVRQRRQEDTGRHRPRHRLQGAQKQRRERLLLERQEDNEGRDSDLLEVSGLSPSGLNIIPQGAATRVADQTPDEKRKMIEEVVGIARFDDKKAEAQKQLSGRHQAPDRARKDG